MPFGLHLAEDKLGPTWMCSPAEPHAAPVATPLLSNPITCRSAWKAQQDGKEHAPVPWLLLTFKEYTAAGLGAAEGGCAQCGPYCMEHPLGL